MGWTLSFLDYNDEPCRVEINGGGTSLLGEANPIAWQEDDDGDLTSPVRIKTGYLRLIERTAGELDGLIPTSSTSHSISVYRNDKVVFRGFLQPQSFNNNWGPTPRIVEFPITSPLGVLNAKRLSIAPPQFVTLANLLHKSIASIGVYSTVVFPADLYASNSSAVIGLHNLIDSQIVCPFNNSATVSNPDAELYDPNTNLFFIEALCLAFGLVAHDEPGKLIFSKPDYEGEYYSYSVASLSSSPSGTKISGSSVDILAQMEVASADNTEELQLPYNGLSLSYDGEVVRQAEFNVTRSRYVRIMQDAESLGVLLTPRSDEFTSRYLNTSAAIGSEGKLTANGVFLGAFGSKKSITPGILLYLSSAQSGDLFNVKFYTQPYDGFRLMYDTKSGDELKKLEADNFSLAATIKCGTKYYTTNGWQDTSASYVLTPQEGAAEVYITPPPQKGYPLEVSFARSGTSLENNKFALISNLRIERTSHIGEQYMPKVDDKTYFEGDINAREQKSLTLPFSFRRQNSNSLFDSGRSGVVLADHPTYDYLFRPQRRLTLALRGDMPDTMYLNSYSIYGYTYRLIAHGYSAKTNIHDLIFQTVD